MAIGDCLMDLSDKGTESLYNWLDELISQNIIMEFSDLCTFPHL